MNNQSITPPPPIPRNVILYNIVYLFSTFYKTLFDTKHIQINLYLNLINCTQT